VKLHAAEQAAKDTPERHSVDQANWPPAGQEVAIDAEEQRWESGVASFAFGEDAEVLEDRGGITDERQSPAKAVTKAEYGHSHVAHRSWQSLL
jgi:hypothetical protein